VWIICYKSGLNSNKVCLIKNYFVNIRTTLIIKVGKKQGQDTLWFHSKQNKFYFLQNKLQSTSNMVDKSWGTNTVAVSVAVKMLS